jgi:hypothetical protein
MRGCGGSNRKRLPSSVRQPLGGGGPRRCGSALVAVSLASYRFAETPGRSYRRP